MKNSRDSSNFYSIIGISMGDEGKGRVVHEILDQSEKISGSPPGSVIKVNGGANAGHTAAGLKLNLLPSGVGNPNVNKLIIGSGVVADPRKFLWEAIPLEKRGIRVLDRLIIDEKTQVSDLTHRLLDLSWEDYRVKQLGMEKRGSTGRGISPAYSDETGQWQIFYHYFTEDRIEFRNILHQRVKRAMDTIRHVCKVSEQDWNNFFQTLTTAEKNANIESINSGVFCESEFNFEVFKGSIPFSLNIDLLEDVYWNAGQRLVHTIRDIRDEILTDVRKNKVIVAEFGQAYWLDKRHGFTPNVTASHTTSPELFLSTGIPAQEVTTVGCCKAYDTKVGTHHFITQIDHLSHPLGKKLAKLEFGTSTGRQRMVGWFDAVEKGNALRYGGFDQIVINKLDALSIGELNDEQMLRICTGYKMITGEKILQVPRRESLRRKLKPIYELLPSWKENISGISSFDDLPVEAKKYVSRMLSSIFEVAYPEGFENEKLPKLRFIGVGPDPGQIITELPSTLDLINGI